MYLFSDTDERLISPGMGEEARHRGNVYCNLKTIGRVYSTAMACPPCCPGSHLGIVLTTRIASASSNGDMLRNTFILDMLPSLPTIICRMTLPCSLFFCAIVGYLMFLARYCIRPGIPPGNLGITSATLSAVPDFASVALALESSFGPYATTTTSSRSACFISFPFEGAGPYRRKVTGTVNLTFTACPLCLPGFQLGMAAITRSASLSR